MFKNAIKPLYHSVIVDSGSEIDFFIGFPTHYRSFFIFFDLEMILLALARYRKMQQQMQVLH